MSWQTWVRGGEIEPSLYAADFTRLGSQIENLLAAGTRVFHFDMGDGHFIEPVTIGPIVIESIAPLIQSGGGVLDCHLMVSEPGRHLRQVAEAGGDSVTIHVETCDVAATAEAARALGLGVGVALNPETPVETALALADHVDLVLCMSIHPGYSGMPFMREALPRIASLRANLPGRVHVQVDGGVKPDNLRLIREAGADLMVVGSGIFAAPDPGAAYTQLTASLTVTHA
jgi:ribulose-phosphate 3-epimerase